MTTGLRCCDRRVNRPTETDVRKQAPLAYTVRAQSKRARRNIYLCLTSLQGFSKDWARCCEGRHERKRNGHRFTWRPQCAHEVLVQVVASVFLLLPLGENGPTP